MAWVVLLFGIIYIVYFLFKSLFITVGRANSSNVTDKSELAYIGFMKIVGVLKKPLLYIGLAIVLIIFLGFLYELAMDYSRSNSAPSVAQIEVEEVAAVPPAESLEIVSLSHSPASFVQTFAKTAFVFFCGVVTFLSLFISVVIEAVAYIIPWIDDGNFSVTRQIWHFYIDEVFIEWYWRPAVWWHVLTSLVSFGALLTPKN